MKRQLTSLFGFPLVTAFAITTLGAPLTAHAKTFRNAYLSFELPDKWDCQLEHTEWVCRTNSASMDSREAVIILTAKEVGPTDALPTYESHLKAPRTIASRSGQPMQSTVYKVDQRIIQGQPWIDGMHFGSEVPNYYTRYVATIKDRIAVLVTFSAYKLHYTKYGPDFIRAIESLRVVASPGLMRANGPGGGNGGIPGSSEMVGSPTSSIDMAHAGEFPEEGSSGSSDSATKFFGFAFLVGAVGVYLMIKRKQKS